MRAFHLEILFESLKEDILVFQQGQEYIKEFNPTINSIFSQEYYPSIAELLPWYNLQDTIRSMSCNIEVQNTVIHVIDSIQYACLFLSIHNQAITFLHEQGSISEEGQEKLPLAHVVWS